ncbi:MAG: 3-phosphoshikimate 1-carboxyvinyltransferase, partial [Phycisphaerales bacterium]
MPRELELCPCSGGFDVAVRPPGSKSLTNRALLLAALAEGESVLRGCLLDADDARVMIEALRQLGAGVEVRDDATWGNEVRVRGVAGRFRVGASGVELNLNNAGTATRFLAAAACLADGPVVIDGNPRMRLRPIGELVELMRRLGVRVDELGAPGCVPLRVQPCQPVGGSIDVGVTLSSQYVSALLLIAPWMEKGLEVRFTAAPTSPSYIDMTLRLLREVGCATALRDESWKRARVSHGGGKGLGEFVVDIEPDASGATYFWGAAAVVPGASATVLGLPEDSMQGDAWFKALLCRMGAGLGEERRTEEQAERIHRDDARALVGRTLTGIDADLSLMPDTAMTAAAAACFASGPTILRGLRTLRVKETDRLAALQNELSKIGVKVEIESYVTEGGVADELMRITPPIEGVDCSRGAGRVEFETYDDHRMAMSLAIIGLRRPNVVIRDPGCVAKTYAGFWGEWAGLY